MWILLTIKPPTRPSPPKLSIFWAVPWPMMERKKTQTLDFDDDLDDDEKGLMFWPSGGDSNISINGHIQPAGAYTRDPDYMGAVKISYAGHDIRVFPHEFSKLDAQRMHYYVFGMPGENIPSHDYIPSNVAGEKLQQEVLSGDLRPLYDYALIEGCTPAQAFVVAMGGDVTDEEIEFEPVGWYKCKPKFAEVFCHSWEMEETPALSKEEEEEIEQLKRERSRKSKRRKKRSDVLHSLTGEWV
jgi:hypothetical protein